MYEDTTGVMPVTEALSNDFVASFQFDEYFFFMVRSWAYWALKFDRNPIILQIRNNLLVNHLLSVINPDVFILFVKVMKVEAKNLQDFPCFLKNVNS